MESFSYSSSSCSSTYLFLNSQEEKKYSKPPPPPPSYHSSLHSVRKLPAKPWKKMAIAPLPPTPARVYKVDSINFKELVQKLTGRATTTTTIQLQSRRLQTVAPPPLSLSKPTLSDTDHHVTFAVPLQLLSNSPNNKTTPLSATLMSTETKPRKYFSPDNLAAVMSPLGFSLSPSSSHAWCSFPLLSPGTLSSLEQSPVL